VLYLVRHGRTAANAAGLLQGSLDLPLDEVGKEQVAVLPAYVGPVDRVIASPMLRAQQTAEVFGRPVETDERWRELDYGELEGRGVTDVDDPTWARWRSDADFAPGGAETLRHLGARVWPACEELMAEIATTSVVVVSHVTPIKAAAAWVLGADLLSTWRCYLDQASLCRIDIWGHGPVLTQFNVRP
jgi:alpha-ribazole phosphatase